VSGEGAGIRGFTAFIVFSTVAVVGCVVVMALKAGRAPLLHADPPLCVHIW